ncbi:MAG: lysophospholipid acyltransferase family protein [Myxococcota bacterium]
MANPARSLLGSVLWFPWSLVAWLSTLGTMMIIAIISLPIVLFVPFEKFQHKVFHDKCAWPLYLMFSPLRVIRDEKYDPSRVSVYTQNHVTMLDANIAIGSIRVPLCGLENASHLNVPGYGWLLRISNAIPVRKGASRFRRIAEAFRERASRGISVLAFPEGHRTLDAHLGKLKTGVFRAARDAGLPIVPVMSRGASRLLPKGSFTIRPSPIEVYIAPQIETEGLTDEQIPLLMERVREVMEAWIERKEMLGHRCLEPL